MCHAHTYNDPTTLENGHRTTAVTYKEVRIIEEHCYEHYLL